MFDILSRSYGSAGAVFFLYSDKISRAPWVFLVGVGVDNFFGSLILVGGFIFFPGGGGL